MRSSSLLFAAHGSFNGSPAGMEPEWLLWDPERPRDVELVAKLVGVDYLTSYIFVQSLLDMLSRGPPLPEAPASALLAAALEVAEPLLRLLAPPADPGKPHQQPDGHEGHDEQRLHGLGEDGAAEQEQADAAEDDGRGDPGLVGAFEVGLADAQDDEAQDRLEVEGVPGDAVEGDERVEAAGDDVDGCDGGVEQHGADGGEEEARVWVGEPGHQLLGHFAGGGGGGVEADGAVALAESNGAEEAGHVAFLSCGVDQAARGEGGGVEGAEAAAGDEEGEDEGADGAEHLAAKGDGDGVGGLDHVGG